MIKAANNNDKLMFGNVRPKGAPTKGRTAKNYMIFMSCRSYTLTKNEMSLCMDTKGHYIDIFN